MDITHAGQQLIFYSDVIVDFFLYISLFIAYFTMIIVLCVYLCHWFGFYLFMFNKYHFSFVHFRCSILCMCMLIYVCIFMYESFIESISVLFIYFWFFVCICTNIYMCVFLYICIFLNDWYVNCVFFSGLCSLCTYMHEGINIYFILHAFVYLYSWYVEYTVLV